MPANLFASEETLREENVVRIIVRLRLHMSDQANQTRPYFLTKVNKFIYLDYSNFTNPWESVGTAWRLRHVAIHS